MSSVLDFISQLYFDLDPGQPCYQDAAGNSLAATSEAVGNVPNQAGGTPVTQANTSHKPTLLVDELDWPYLYFDGSDDYLTNNTFQPDTGNQPFEVTVVQTIMNLGVWLCDGSTGRFTKTYGERLQITFGANYTSATATLNEGIQQSVVAGASSEIFFNGVSTGPPGNAGPNPWWAGIYIGARSTKDAYVESKLWRLLVHEVLSPTNRTGLYNYLNNLYSNPRPSIGIPPSFVHHHLQMMEAR